MELRSLDSVLHRLGILLRSFDSRPKFDFPHEKYPASARDRLKIPILGVPQVGISQKCHFCGTHITFAIGNIIYTPTRRVGYFW
jgi:hypothetical protein